MKILDMFSWLPAHEMSLEKIEEIFKNHMQGNQIEDKYLISNVLPENISEDIRQYKKESIEAGKKIACIIEGDVLVALVGYQE